MNVLSQFIKSLHSPKHIALFRFQGIGKTILYLFVLMCITLIPIAIVFGMNFSQMFKNLELSLGQETPNFQIKNGVLEAEVTEPYITSVNDAYFIIDPNNALEMEAIKKDYRQAIVLAEHDAYFVDGTTVNEFRYRNFGHINLSKDEMRELIDSLTSLLPILLPIFLIVIYLIVTGLKFIGVSVLALIGLALIRAIKPNNINYRHLWIMSAYAVTLPTTIFNLADAFQLAVPVPFWLYWTIAVAILYAALQSIPKRKTPTT